MSPIKKTKEKFVRSIFDIMIPPILTSRLLILAALVIILPFSGQAQAKIVIPSPPVAFVLGGWIAEGLSSLYSSPEPNLANGNNGAKVEQEGSFSWISSLSPAAWAEALLDGGRSGVAWIGEKVREVKDALVSDATSMWDTVSGAAASRAAAEADAEGQRWFDSVLDAMAEGDQRREDAQTFANLVDAFFIDQSRMTSAASKAKDRSVVFTKEGTEIHTGKLVGNTNTLQGKINNKGQLEFAQSYKGDFRGTIYGPGKVSINSPGGVVVFNTDQPYTGETNIEQGKLVVNKWLFSRHVWVGPHGILGGSGIAAGSVINAGLVSPGNSIGTFRINRDYKQLSTGKLLIQIANINSYDKLMVGGVADLNGILQVEGAENLKSPTGPVPRDGTELTVVEAGKGVKGEFKALEPLPGAFQLKARYEDNKVKLVTVQNEIRGKTLTQNSVGKALNKAIATGAATEALGEAIWVINFVQPEKLGPYLDALIPRPAAIIKDILFNSSNMLYGQLVEREGTLRAGVGRITLNGLSQEPMTQQMSAHEATLRDKSGKTLAYRDSLLETSPWSLFATASGVFSKITTARDLPRLNSMTGYFSVGTDCRVSQHVNTGVYVGYQGSKSWYSDGSWLKGNGVKFGLYGTSQWKGFYVNAIVGAGYNRFDMHRPIDIGRNHWAARGRSSALELNSLLGGGYELPVGPLRLGVNSSLQYTYLGISSFQESGARNLNVKVGGQNPSSLVSTLGGNISYHWELSPDHKIIPTLGLAWQHEFLNYGQKIAGAFANGSGPHFQFASTKGARNNAFGTAGIAAQLGKHFGSYIYYNPQFGGGQVLAHGLLVGLNYNF